MKRTILENSLFAWTLFVIVALAAVAPVALSLLYVRPYGFFRVPIASWVVLGLGAMALLADLITVLYRRTLRRARAQLDQANQALVELQKQPTEFKIPAILGHEHLPRAEHMVIVQTLFRPPPDVQYVHVKPLSEGYSGSTTVLARLQRRQGESPLPRSFVVKLGDRGEVAGEYEKFHNYVLTALSRAPSFFRRADWQELAGIAYEFAGLDLDAEILGLHQFYAGNAAVEVVELIGEVYAQLGRAWYQRGECGPVDLYQEYDLLRLKRQQIVESVGRIVDEDDPYHVNFSASEKELRPQLKPRFCPDLEIPWYDPVVLLRTWPKGKLALPVHRSVVHGDLNARNVLVEIGRDGQKRVWFIDFSHTGNGLSAGRADEAARAGVPVAPDRGHTLRDFCRLEADVKFVLTRLQSDHDLRPAVALEKTLLEHGSRLSDFPVAAPPVDALIDERFKKAWQVVGEIRRRAAAYLVNPDDPRPYFLGLLHATLPIVYYHPGQFENQECAQQQKRYALLAAGMLCSQL